MNNVRRTTGAILMAVLLLGGGLAATIASTMTTIVVAAPQAQQPVPTEVQQQPLPCINGMPAHFYANTAKEHKEGPRSFGPPATMRGSQPGLYQPIMTAPNHGQVVMELEKRLCGHADIAYTHGGDKALYLALLSMADGGDPNRHLSQKEWGDGLEYLVRQGFQHHKARIEYRPTGSGYTLLMEPTTNGSTPEVRAMKTDDAGGWYYIVPVVRPDGSTITLELRLDCGFQPHVNNATQLPVSLQALV